MPKYLIKVKASDTQCESDAVIWDRLAKLGFQPDTEFGLIALDQAAEHWMVRGELSDTAAKGINEFEQYQVFPDFQISTSNKLKENK